MIDAVSVHSVVPEARNGVALGHEGDKDGRAASKDDGAHQQHVSSKLAHGEDAPVEEKDPNLDNCYSKRPIHHVDVENLD